MKQIRLIKIGGVINILFAFFHLSFWKMFEWGTDLANLTAENSAIMQVLNIHTVYVLIVFAILSLVLANELSNTRLGRFVSFAIASFWVLRVVNQAIFWGVAFIGSWIIMAVCLGIALLYFIPALKTKIS